MDYVHGYRGYDCRDNLFYSAKGEIIYHLAALGIVYDKNEKKQRFYTKHTDDILCLDVHPERLIVATGQIGAKPPIHIWEIESMQTLSILQVYSRIMNNCNFSYTILVIFSFQNGTIYLVESYIICFSRRYLA